MFGKKLQIGEGDKYDLSKVSTETVSQEEVAKKNAKLIEIFKSFDKNNDGKLSSAEMALALEAFDSLDISGDDKISKKEFQEAAENFNKNMKLEGKDQVDAKDLKTFIKNLFKATKNDPTAETQKVIEQYNKEQEQIALQQKQDAVEADAKRRGWEWSLDGAYWDKKNNKYYLPNADMTAFEEVHWSDSEQKFKVMSADELAELEAAKAAEAEAERKAAEKAKAAETPQLHKYIVQSGDKFTEVISKALQAQGIENPTQEQIAEAKEQFKQDNPNAVRSTEDGYEFLLVGAEVNLRGKVDFSKNSEEAVAQWAKANEGLVSEAYKKDHRAPNEVPEVVVTASAPTEEQRVRGAKAKEMGLEGARISGLYRKFGSDGHYEYYQWDDKKQDFVNVKNTGVLSVTEPNQYTDQYILRRAVKGGGYNDAVFDKNNNPVKTLKYNKNRTYTGYVEYDYWAGGCNEYTYDANNNKTKFVSKDYRGNVQDSREYTYDANNNMTKEVLKDANGNVELFWEYTYDANNNNKTKEVLKDANGNVKFSWEYTYDANNNKTKEVLKDANGNVIKFRELGSDGKWIYYNASGAQISEDEYYKL